MPDKWDEEDDSSTPPSSPPAKATIARRGKFDDEEEDDNDVLDSWDAAEDSEVEREKAKAAAERKAKADAEAAANKKSKKQRIEEREAERRRLAEEESEEESSEDEAERRERLRRTEQEADLKHAEDLFGNLGVSSSRKVATAANAVVIDSKDPSNTVDLGALPLFDPKTKAQFEKLRETLVPLLAGNSKKAHYALFLQEFTKQIAKDLPSDQIKKIASSLTALSNEKLKEEKAQDKSGKKTKAQKTKTTLVASRNAATAVDVNAYDDYDDDDFM
ncbi:putative eukaryotic translation initiation factor 3 subunit J [Xylogone sp. PMI_703]|nr:putative eukaryotic translation initiation factor 3 subunit J [Xylogone sp. PMI_703]